MTAERGTVNAASGVPLSSLKLPVSTGRQADYFSGAGTSKFTFRYVVQSTDTSADLSNGSPLSCGGPSICLTASHTTNPLSNLLTTTLLSGVKAIVIDAVAPSAPTSPTVTTAGGNVVPGYVNSTNTSVTISATITAAQVGTTGTAQMLVGTTSVATTT